MDRRSFLTVLGAGGLATALARAEAAAPAAARPEAAEVPSRAADPQQAAAYPDDFELGLAFSVGAAVDVPFV